MNLLFTTTRLGIGGAETHLIDLCLALQAKGHTITVVSAGGCLVSRLLRHGIRHIQAPLDRTDPKSLIRSVSLLARLIKSGGFDVIHAHARIPALLSALPARIFSIPLVVTAHGKYDLSFPKRSLSQWGDVTLAVSPAIKAHLIDAYHLPSSSISLTVNGIDTSHFTRSEPPLSSRPLLHVTRLDHDSSLCAEHLIALAPKIKAAVPEFTLWIVGDGKKKAELARRASPLPYIRFLGACADPLPYYRAAWGMIGVSRAALEAMSCALPVILSGNLGFCGIFTPRIYPLCRGDNFCASTPSCADMEGQMLKSILSLYAMSEEERKIMGETNRNIVCRHHASPLMAEHALECYQRAIARASGGQSALILGYLGYGNCGDEAMLSGMVANLRKKHPRLCLSAISHRPKDTEKRHAIQAIHRASPRLLFRIARAHHFFLGGGSLLCSSPSFRSLLYYAFMTLLAKLLRCRIHLVGMGISQPKTPLSQSIVRAVLSLADTVLVRDTASLAVVSSLAPSVSARLCPDPALFSSDPSSDWKEYLSRSLGICPLKCFAVMLRSVRGIGRREERKLARAICRLQEKTKKQALFFLMDKEKDGEISRRVAADIPNARVLPALSFEDTRAILSLCSFALPMRLHGAVLAHKLGIRCFVLSYDVKTEAFCTDHKIPFLKIKNASRKRGV